MFDQMSPQSLPAYGHPLVQAPNLQALAERGVVFDSAYCNAPLCAPSRFSMMAGQLPSRIGAWDNAAEFPSSVPTYAHYLRRLGYRTCLAGKMHFVGADQLHGYEDRVTTDIYPGDFGWTPTWDEPTKIHWWFHNMLSVVEAGPYDRSLEWDYDEDVCHQAVRWLYDHARGTDERPFMLTVSYIQPHDPYLAPREDWARYDHASIDMPAVPYVPLADRDPLSRRMYDLYDRDEYRITDEHVRNARHGYYAMITYVDRKFGELLAALEATGLDDDTIVIVTADHGDMLGERGLWFKMCFFEGSARVPLMIAGRGVKPGLVETPVSNLDILPTLSELAGVDMSAVLPWTDGQSLLLLTRGERRTQPVLMEYAAEGSYAPLVAIRDGKNKFIHCEIDPPQLFDLESDPLERTNLAADPAHAGLVAEFMEKVRARWDMAAFDAAVRESQARRWVVYPALCNGAYYPWEFQPLQKASERYMRNHMNLDNLEESKRFPRGE